MARKSTDIKHKLSNGKTITVKFEELFGLYDIPEKLITIVPHKRNCNREMMDTIIHELLHAEFPSWSENKVEKLGNSISTLLWNVGYRIKKKKT